MFFWVSKIFWLLAQPISVVFLLLLAAVLAVLSGRKRIAVAALVLGLLVQGAVSFTNLGYVILQPLEDRFAIPATAPEAVDAIIMLGGATLERPSSARQIAELNEAGDRLTTTLWLARKYPRAQIVISGGSGALTDEGEAEATTAARVFRAFDIPEARLVLEGESRNTDENVAYTKSLLGDAKSIILVTSAFHMPRSVGLFRKLGLAVLPWPTDYRTTGKASLGLDLTQPSTNAQLMTTALREWTGLAFYHLAGRTDAFLPQ